MNLVLCALCGIGLKTFSETSTQEKLWVPQSSRVINEKAWVDMTFPQETRYATFVTVDAERNVLTPKFINAVRSMSF